MHPLYRSLEASLQNEKASKPVTASQQPSEKAARFQCDQCSRSFQRCEHLKRHQRGKHGEGDCKPFGCSQCSKRFSRSDVLNRHVLIHSYQDEAGNPNGTTGATSQNNRACTECAKARAKCSKGEICTRCFSRSLVCTYPTTRKRKRRASAYTVDEIESESFDSGNSDFGNDSQTSDSHFPETPIDFDPWAMEAAFAQASQALPSSGIPEFDMITPTHAPMGSPGHYVEYGVTGPIDVHVRQRTCLPDHYNLGPPACSQIPSPFDEPPMPYPVEMLHTPPSHQWVSPPTEMHYNYAAMIANNMAVNSPQEPCHPFQPTGRRHAYV